MTVIFMNALPEQKFWGLLEYKPQWTLTLQGWCLLLGLLLVMIALFLWSIYPFLTVSSPLDADVMVVEGWVNDATLKKAIAEFQDKHYRLMIITGTNIRRGALFTQYKTHADLAAATVIALGLDPQKVVAVPNQAVKVNRTAASAIAVKHWLSQSGLTIKQLNIYSHDVHTRRSWAIFRRVLAPEIKVGAIAHRSAYYQKIPWWRTSDGTKAVMVETIAYLYVRFFWVNR